MSFFILLILFSSEMFVPALNITNTDEIRDFERECTLMEQGQQFFESAFPLGDCKVKWCHVMLCQPNQCLWWSIVIWPDKGIGTDTSLI